MKTIPPLLLTILAALLFACKPSTQTPALILPSTSTITTEERTLAITPGRPPEEVTPIPTDELQAAFWNPINVLAIDPREPNIVFAGTAYAGLYKSVDGGLNWTTPVHAPDIDSIGTVVIDLLHTNMIFAGTEGGIIESTDDGENWSVVDSAQEYILDLAIDPLNPSTLYAVTSSGAIKSVNEGESWDIITGLPSTDVSFITIDQATPTTLYIGTFSLGILKSMDGGNTWREIDTALTNPHPSDLVIDPRTPSILYSSGTDGIFRSSNAGESWSLVNPATAHEYITFLAIDPLTPTTLYAINDRGGLYKSEDSGVGWFEVNSRLTEIKVHTLAIDPVTPATLYAGTEHGVFKSLDSGENWQAMNLGMRPPLLNPPHTPATTLAPTAAPLPPMPPQPTQPTSTPEDWRTVMQAFAVNSMNNTPLAGLTMAIRRPGDPDWIQAYGFADLQASLPATIDTEYPIGSLSMQFTAAAIMQLVERGQLDLYAPISQYIEDLPVNLQFITTDQLLRHTSLIRDPAIDTQLMFFNEEDFTPETLMQQLVPILSIGSEQSFSYGNYILAGMILERVSGMSYQDYMNQFIFAPAGLQHTTYCLTPPPDLARTYYIPDSKFEPIKLNISAAFAAGGLCSTAGDMLLWVDALTSGKVVSHASYQQMILPDSLINQTVSGYGLITMQDPTYGLQFLYIGFEASFVSDLVVIPEKGLIIVLLSNTAVPGNNLLETIWEKLPVLIP